MRKPAERIRITKDTPIEEILKIGKSCDKCGHCCSYGTGYMLKSELKKISEFLNFEIEKLKAEYLDEVDLYNTILYKPKTIKSGGKPFGKCVFLDQNKTCTIHSVKPIQCRIGSCKEMGTELMEWFYLNFCVNPTDSASITQWKEKLKIHPTIEGGLIEDLLPDKEIRKKMLKEE